VRIERSDTLGDAICALSDRPWEIQLYSKFSDEQRRKVCESKTESEAEKEEIDKWVFDYKRCGFNSMELIVFKNTFDQLRKLEISYQNSIKGALGGRGKKGGIQSKKTREKKV
jgi:hypothetical protein